jgi:hypothetical protein
LLVSHSSRRRRSSSSSSVPNKHATICTCSSSLVLLFPHVSLKGGGCHCGASGALAGGAPPHLLYIQLIHCFSCFLFLSAFFKGGGCRCGASDVPAGGTPPSIGQAGASLAAYGPHLRSAVHTADTQLLFSLFVSPHRWWLLLWGIRRAGWWRPPIFHHLWTQLIPVAFLFVCISHRWWLPLWGIRRAGWWRPPPHLPARLGLPWRHTSPRQTTHNMLPSCSLFSYLTGGVCRCGASARWLVAPPPFTAHIAHTLLLFVLHFLKVVAAAVGHPSRRLVAPPHIPARMGLSWRHSAPGQARLEAGAPP